jgi:hypothetical protein
LRTIAAFLPGTPRSDMEYTIQAEGEMLKAKVWGRDDDQPPSRVCKEILQECNRLGIHRVLVELTQKVPLSSVSQFRVVEALPTLGMTYKHRIALVHHTPGFFEANELIGIVAENRGLNLRNFKDVDTALAWLR